MPSSLAATTTDGSRTIRVRRRTPYTAVHSARATLLLKWSVAPAGRQDGNVVARGAGQRREHLMRSWH